MEYFGPSSAGLYRLFFDDILVNNSSEQEHVTHLAMVLQTFEEHQLYVNYKKCEIRLPEVAYLDHKISVQGVDVDMDKEQAIAQPKNLWELPGILELTGYYHKFKANYAHIPNPLTAQLKKDCFGWSSEATQAFATLKMAMTQALVLMMLNFQLPFILETDASGFGVGAVLM